VLFQGFLNYIKVLRYRENIAEAIQILPQRYNGLHRPLDVKFSMALQGAGSQQLPVLGRSAWPHELVVAITVLRHLLYTQLNSQAKLEQLKLSKSYPSTWP
jgi:hypothetical protein